MEFGVCLKDIGAFGHWGLTSNDFEVKGVKGFMGLEVHHDGAEGVGSLEY